MNLSEIVPIAANPKKAKLRFHLHRGQLCALTSQKRFVLILAGTQSGKTSFGPLWLWREIQRRGPGDYLVVAPTFPLLIKKALPEFLRLFKKQLRLGDYQTQEKIFTFSDAGCKIAFGQIPEQPTQIFFGHAQDPDSLESATAKAAWLDEAGQRKFRLGSWEAILRRLSIHEGRALMTTTPYDLGWLKQTLWDKWNDAKGQHPLIDVIRFDSTENPAFPKAEFERARDSMPAWRFDLFYRGIFTRPAGLIYTSFDPRKHTMPRFTIPPEWNRYLGLDFGGVNTAGVYLAEERCGTVPTGRLIAYREYHAGDRSAADHIHHLLRGDALNEPEPGIPRCAGGSKSEGQWRKEFSRGGMVGGRRIAGLPIHGPAVTNIEVGINRVWREFRRDQLIIFDDLKGLLDELQSYSREVDDAGEVTDKVDGAENYHHLDALRYLVGYLNRDKPKPTMARSPVARYGPFGPTCPVPHAPRPRQRFGLGFVAHPGLQNL